MKYLFLLSLVIALISCGDNQKSLIKDLESKMNSVAEDYVKLVLEIGKYKNDYVDAYYGPEEWNPDYSDSHLDSAVISSLEKKVDGLRSNLVLKFMGFDACIGLRTAYYVTSNVIRPTIRASKPFNEIQPHNPSP